MPKFSVTDYVFNTEKYSSLNVIGWKIFISNVPFGVCPVPTEAAVLGLSFHLLRLSSVSSSTCRSIIRIFNMKQFYPIQIVSLLSGGTSLCHREVGADSFLGGKFSDPF